MLLQYFGWVGGFLLAAERQPFDAFAEMAAFAHQAMFSTALLRRSGFSAEASIQGSSRPSTVARGGLTFPNRLHKPQGRS